jgi:hypothetical protein
MVYSRSHNPWDDQCTYGGNALDMRNNLLD